ncbi:divalent-cation tolerance protein CutA [Desulfotignum phosphitoxidans]|uniref:Divalent ion tolerance protein CutA n=1 Tax=Desulfotignum phosphitoxidans DSM 13687 TaxID=1286635 RepID=S0G7S3_9BACT|nr:divalent-cation tolerance protein CutA [Desulfotignum phosphitoxidans]EMS81131.1 divalent ion tolerance protein CutA [Desulfotignum phosphitoxidans DSM 13687]
MSYCMVLVTCKDETEARSLASRIVHDKLAACVQMNPVVSVYTWEGRVQTETETRLTIKTRTSLYPALESFIRTHHTYEVPQIVQIPISRGLPEFLDWIDQTTGA